MFFTYLSRELRRRARATVAVALGLALGIALVIGASSASAGIKTAQGSVLHSLYGVGTDITVTRTATAGTGGPQSFGARSTGTQPKRISQNALHAEPGQGTLTAANVATISSVSGVKTAVGVLALNDVNFSGAFHQRPSSSSSSSSGASGGGYGGGSGSGYAGSSGTGGAPGGFSGNFNLNSFSVDGVTITSAGIGPVSAAQVTSGRYFRTGENTADVAVVNSSYAHQHSLTVGGTVSVAGKKMQVIGLTSSSTANVYLPLGTAQALAGMKNDVTTVYVSAAEANSVSTVGAAIRSSVPSTTVTTSAGLASEVTGSLSSASSLVSKLGTGISIAGLVLAFLVTALMMSSAVTRRVREFGTLKAIGWRTRRIVGQVLGEGLVIGVLGAVAGVAIGIGIAALITAFSPGLTATVGATSASTAVGFAAHAFGQTSSSVLVHLTAPLQGGAIALAIALALLGGLLAGGVGAWRAARLRPAEALRRTE